MTIQVGMIGTDGLLIAGDTRWTNTPALTNRNWAGGRFGHNASKITIVQEQGAAISCARSMDTARHISNKIIAALPHTETAERPLLIERMGKEVLDASSEKLDAQCLIAFAHPVPQLFLFQYATINEKWSAFCQKMETIAIAGDNVNAAIFWAERYYRPRSVELLIPLATHLVVSAERLNTGTISGLEIVTCTDKGIRRLSDESINRLRAQSEEWDRSMGELFLNHREQFSYSPNVIG